MALNVGKKKNNGSNLKELERKLKEGKRGAKGRRGHMDTSAIKIDREPE